MTRTRHALTIGLVALLAGLVSLPAIAEADRRKSPLEGQPAVRHRLLLVEKRFEATPLFEASINADFKHTIGGGLKLEYHLSDMFSIGGLGVFSGSFNTDLTKRILKTLPDTSQDDPTPTKLQYRSHLNEMPFHGAAYVSLTPWYGKLAAFGKGFVNFDFYFQIGVAFALLDSDCADNVCDDPNPGGIPGMELPDNNPNNDPPLNDGFELGLYAGGGIHVFFTEWIAMDLTVRDYFFNDNPSGLDFDADLAVKEKDKRFMSHLFFGVGASIFFPFNAKRTP